MNNNSVGSIAVSNTKRPRARFNLSADLHTSMDFGSVIPARVHLQMPNSKVVCSSTERVLCSPLLAPTMGRLSLKAYHNFVRLSDLTENFAPMLAQERVSRGTSQFVPLSVPSITVRALSLFVLTGAYMNFYKQNASGVTGDSADVNACSSPVYSGTSGDLATDADLSALGILTKVSGDSVYGIANYFLLSSDLVFGYSGHPTRGIPLGNPNNGTFYPVDPSCSYFEANKDWYDLSDVTPQNADYVIPVTVGTDTYYLCFRLSDFGKRLRKVLIGCGYQIDFTSSQSVSVLPLCAYFKSYFDVFGLTLYTNWEQSECYRFLRSADLSASPSLADFWNLSTISGSTIPGFFRTFMIKEVGLCFYTDEHDFVSAHTVSESVSPAPTGVLDVVDVDNLSGNAYTPNIDVASVAAGQNGNSDLNPSTSTNLSGHAFIDSVIHGQLDSELLKRLYRWTNRNTIAGQRIAEILRAQGLGSYVDECKSDFIGSFELPIDIYDGISNADTYSQAADSGAPLGERFGNGQASTRDDKNKSCERPFTFECNEYGYWVTLFTVVPKGGYTEAFDPTVFALSKFQFYQPDFDSLGMEFSPKSLVQGSMPFADFTAASGKLSDSFGLAPRYFRWKFGRNCANGDFTRRGVRDSFAPYYLDRIIDVGERLVRDVSPSTSIRAFTLVKEFKPLMLPIAGNVWRYPTRYPFIGRFNRIFNRIFASREHGANMSVDRIAEFEYFSGSDDNFILHAIFDVQYFAPMLPVEDSFETFDDDNAPNSSVEKS